MIIYAISTCATSRKAQKALEAAGHAVEFRDVRAEPMSEAEWGTLIAEFGDQLIDRKSPEWRGLSDWLKHSDVEAQLAAKPKLMLTPVIRDGDTYYLGWDETTRAAVLAE
jgi:arsenate reductase-like glutaredoxin family protein